MNLHSRCPLALLVLGMAALLPAAGCRRHVPHSDKPRAAVVIKIISGGEPVTAGDVDLNNLTTGEGGGAKLDSTGTARFEGVVLGDYTVTVFPPLSDPVPLADGSAPAATSPAVKIPAIFQSPEKSPLKLTVTPEGAEASFDLKTALSK
jgi:hypothetical protein